MRLKFVLLSLGAIMLVSGTGACTSTSESTAEGAGTGVRTEDSSFGTDPGSLMVGGAGPGNGGNGGGIGSTLGSH